MTQSRLVFALIAVFVAAGMAQAEPAAVTVSELIAYPRAHLDQHLHISGVVNFSSFGPLLCELPSRNSGRRYDGCIDLDDPTLPFRRFDLRMVGAVVSIVGYFSDECAPPEKAPDVFVVCTDRGSRGFISAESLTRIGYIEQCWFVTCGKADTVAAREIAIDAPEAEGIAAFARAFLSAARSRRPETIAALAGQSWRTELLFDLRRPGRFDERYAALRNSGSSVETASTGYRLFEVGADGTIPRHHELCFCTSGDCGALWLQSLSGAPGRYPSWPVYCLVLWRDAARWWLVSE